MSYPSKNQKLRKNDCVVAKYFYEIIVVRAYEYSDNSQQIPWEFERIRARCDHRGKTQQWFHKSTVATVSSRRELSSVGLSSFPRGLP